MPQICQFLGVNSVTNIELPGGFMPALIYIFADWLENFPSGRFQEGFLQNQAAAGVETAHPNAEWPFALCLRLVAICRLTRSRRRKVGRRRGGWQVSGEHP